MPNKEEVRRVFGLLFDSCEEIRELLERIGRRSDNGETKGVSSEAIEAEKVELSGYLRALYSRKERAVRVGVPEGEVEEFIFERLPEPIRKKLFESV